jgi:hypothetical protein
MTDPSHSSGLEHLSWYAYKGEIRRYLKELNKDKKVSCDGLSEMYRYSDATPRIGSRIHAVPTWLVPELPDEPLSIGYSRPLDGGPNRLQ